MKKLIIGVWQGVSKDGDLEANLVRASSVIDEAGEAGCSFVCLPELFLSGADRIEYQRQGAMSLDDERLRALARKAQQRDVVAIVGMCAKFGDRYGVTAAVLSDGELVGHYTKTMQTGGDKKLMGYFDDELPVFEAKGVRFGVIICHDSSFPEVAATMAWKGARIIFSPHYNSIKPQTMDEHRILVRNNHVGIAAHYGVVVARANSVGTWDDPPRLGYGDSAIFSPTGAVLAEAGLFGERLITCDVGPYLGDPRFRRRTELRPAIINQLSEAALAALAEAQGDS